MNVRIPCVVAVLVASVLLPGCGLLVDLDPPDDAGTVPTMDAGLVDAGDGMDAARPDAARPDAGLPADCTEDAECDDGLFCNGFERCALGRCEGGRPVECDDGIDCTTDRCDEGADACVVALDDAACGTAPVECAEQRCLAGVGCVTRRLNTACEDGVPCTVDRCEESGCTHTPSDGLCLSGEYCSEADGCRAIPTCSSDGDCPHKLCNGSPRCVGGECQYAPITNDSGCRVSDPCTPTYCESGVCVIEAPVDCGSADATTCTVPVCARDPSGRAVTCVDMPRSGACVATTPCHTGSCDGEGRCVETNACPTASDACHVPVCTAGGGCGEAALVCGANASCVVTSGSANCQCAAGWSHCDASDTACLCPDVDAGTTVRPDAGSPPDAGRDAMAPDPACALPGRRDCDGNGTCECRPLLSRCNAGRCECLLTCGLGLQCCRDMLLDIGYCGVVGTCAMPP